MLILSVGGVLCVLLLHLCFLSVIGLYFLEKGLSFQNFRRFGVLFQKQIRPDALCPSGRMSPKIVPVAFPSGRPIFRPDGCFRRIFRRQPDKKKKKKIRTSIKNHCFVCVLGTFHYYDEIEFIHGIKKSLNIILGLNVILWLMIFYDCYGLIKFTL